jgi:hypothetical protein
MARKRKPTSKAPAKSAAQPQIDEETQESYVRGLLVRGEAARSVDGKLPPGATHEIVEEREGELPKVRRRRYSAF